MGVTVADLVKSFDELGVEYDNSILNECLEICKRHDVSDAEEFVDSWVAYSLSKLQGENPTISYLHKFEKDEYQTAKKSRYSSDTYQKTSLVIYEANNMSTDKETAPDILKVYGENLSKDNNGSLPRTPDNSSTKAKSNHQASFSPASFSPTITSVSTKYTSRTNSGQIVFSYKNEKFVCNERKSMNSTIKIERLNSVDIERYMNFDLIDCLDYADDLINKIGNILIKKNNLEDPVPVRYKHPSPFITVGRIACDSDGRLNCKSVLLEGSRETSAGETIRLDLDGVEKYSIFPGQVVAVEGVNITGDKLLVKNIYCDASSEPPPTALSCGPLTITVAAGPFTQSDSMTYQPLLDLIESVSSDNPDILILTGPFIDSNHPVIIENSLAETYNDLFRKLVDLIMKPLHQKKTQVLMVSSYKDCTSRCIYPTPQLPLRDKIYPNLHLLPDPSICNVGGIVIGVTSTDTIMHIGKEEISSPEYTTDRLSRLSGHILCQRNFYPLLPASVPADPLFMEFSKIDIVPHILILPSDFRYFIKEVLGCMVVNPERLAKGVIGGTYARLSLTTEGVTGNIVRI